MPQGDPVLDRRKEPRIRFASWLHPSSPSAHLDRYVSGPLGATPSSSAFTPFGLSP